MWSYINQRSKQTHLAYYEKKNLEYEGILYNSTELSVDWPYNPEVIISVSYVSSEITNFQRDLFFKENS